MERNQLNLEDLFVDVAMAEGRDFPTLAEEVDEAHEAFECTCADVAFAEEGGFTGTVCALRSH